MERINVVSSNIKSIGHQQNMLEIEFKNSHIYLYHNVPKNIFFELMQAYSKGKYVSSNIKERYSYRRIR